VFAFLMMCSGECDMEGSNDDHGRSRRLGAKDQG
jgi:hypothetical protein